MSVQIECSARWQDVLPDSRGAGGSTEAMWGGA
jgi:hypothetical protein